jgi:hypothetical protein
MMKKQNRRRASSQSTGRKRRRVVMARMIRRGEDDGSFDAEFWYRAGPAARMAAMWDLVLRYWQMKGRDPRELRLDRSVAVLKRRKKVKTGRQRVCRVRRKK